MELTLTIFLTEDPESLVLFYRMFIIGIFYLFIFCLVEYQELGKPSAVRTAVRMLIEKRMSKHMTKNNNKMEKAKRQQCSY